MTTLLQLVSLKFLPLNTLHDDVRRKPTFCHSHQSSQIGSFNQKRFKVKTFSQKWGSMGTGREKDEFLVKVEEGWRRKQRVVLVRFNQGFGFNGGGGGGRDNSGTVRLLGNIALAIGLTYLSVTGQIGGVLDAIGWVLDALISIWLLAVIIPIVGLGAFLWWAGRDIVQDACPNCGNEFQIFKSTLNDELQLCPFCTQPFSVADDKFVKESVKFSNQSRASRGPFGDFSKSPKKERETSSAIVDVEADVKDAD